MASVGAVAIGCTGLDSVTRASCATGGAGGIVDGGRVFGDAGAGRGVSTRELAPCGALERRGATAGAGATGWAGAGLAVGPAALSDTTPSDCSTAPLEMAAAAAASGVGPFAGRLTRNAPAAPTVIHEAATTATVDVLISITHL